MTLVAGMVVGMETLTATMAVIDGITATVVDTVAGNQFCCIYYNSTVVVEFSASAFNTGFAYIVKIIFYIYEGQQYKKFRVYSRTSLIQHQCSQSLQAMEALANSVVYKISYNITNTVCICSSKNKNYNKHIGTQ